MRLIPRVALSAGLSLFAAMVSPPASHAAAPGPREQSVIAALKEYERAILASDTITLKRIWTDDYRFINTQGVIATRAQRLANIASNATNVAEAVNQREITVRIYGDNAIVQQLFTLRGRFGGQEVDTEVRGMFAWVWRAGRWQMVANQVTPVIP